ncbi:6709_t:CDS:2, partial [Rhizophagus irregularis]
MNPITVVTKPPTTEVTEGPTEKTGNCTIILQYHTPQSQNNFIQQSSSNPSPNYQRQTTSRPHDNIYQNYDNLLEKVKQLENQVHTLTTRISQLENNPKQYETKFSNIENQKKHYTRSSNKSSSPRISADDSDSFPQTEDDTIMHQDLTALTDNAADDGIIEPDSDYTQNDNISGTLSYGYNIFNFGS